jgi:hypothetical protein
LPLDWDRLEKLLNMTASQHDAEVLTAIRMSNNLLKQQRVKWADVLAKPKQIEPEAPSEAKPEFKFDPRHTVLGSVDVAVTEMRARIRSYPVMWRWLLFPIWGAAETYAGVSQAQKTLGDILPATIVAIGVGLVGSLIWVVMLVGLGKALYLW